MTCISRSKTKWQCLRQVRLPHNSPGRCSTVPSEAFATDLGTILFTSDPAGKPVLFDALYPRLSHWGQVSGHDHVGGRQISIFRRV